MGPLLPNTADSRRRILRFLTAHRCRGWALPKTISRELDIRKACVELHLKALLREGIVEKRRAVRVVQAPNVYRLKIAEIL
jgi:predicted transcriptional regulator